MTVLIVVHPGMENKDTITITNLTGSETPDKDLDLGGTDSTKFTANNVKSKAKWTQGTGTLVLTANTSVAENTPVTFKFTLKEPISFQVAVKPFLSVGMLFVELDSSTKGVLGY